MCVFLGPDYTLQKYSDSQDVTEMPREETKEKSLSGSPHFYRKGTTPTQSPSASPGPSPSPSPTAAKKAFYSSKTLASGAEAEALTAGKQLY